MKLTTKLSFLLILFTVTISLSQSNKALKPINETISFEENKGQMKDQHWKARPDVLYYGVSEGMNFYIKNSGMSYQLSRVESWKEEDKDMLRASLGSDDKKRQVPDQIGTYRVDAEWLNANKDFTINRGNALEGYNNYYNVPEGVEPALFVKKYETLTLLNVWNGVDIHYYGNGGFLETDYIVAPGADYHQIQIDIKGAELSTDDQGNLILKTPFGEIREGQLKVYQNDVLIEATWRINQDNVVSFDIPTYNPNIAMVIDPLARVWGTYYGGNLSDVSFGLDTDNSGNIVISGESYSTNSISSGGFQNTYGGGNGDAFVCKFLPNGNRIWATYFGGNQNDRSYSATIQSTGEIVVSGETGSPNNIATGIHQMVLGGLRDVFLLKLAPNGSRIWSTYVGGDDADYGGDNTLDPNGNIYLSGYTSSIDSITLAGYQNTNNGGTYDAFLMKFDSNGNQIWGTFFGGSGYEITGGLVIDTTNSIYLSGQTSSNTNIYHNGHQNSIQGGNDAFLVKFSPNGNRIWSTYYGGSGGENGEAVTVDKMNNVYLTGATTSNNNISFNGYQNIYNGGLNDAFLVKFDENGNRTWGTYYGGNGDDSGSGLNIDKLGNIYISGSTSSISNISWNGFQNSNNGGAYDLFIIKFDNLCNLIWGTYFGGEGYDTGTNPEIDSLGNNIIVTGYTNSSVNISANGFQNSFGGGGSDGFLVKLRSETADVALFATGLFTLYPNPTSSEITITSDKFTNEPYTLYDQMGRTVGSGKLSGTNTTISLSTLSKGIYILKVEGAYESAIVVKE